MAYSMEIQAPPQYIEGETDWESYIKRFEMYFVCANITDHVRKLAMLLYCGGKCIHHVHDTLGIELYDDTGAILKEDDGNGNQVDIDVYKTSVEALTNHFIPEKNITYERNCFRAEQQLLDESSAAFVTRLRKLAQSCKFEEYSTDKAIIDQYIEKCSSPKLRILLLKEKNLTLDHLLQIAKTHESSRVQADTIQQKLNRCDIQETSGVELVNANFRRNEKQQSQSSRSLYCYGCGTRNHIHGSSKCPAANKKCLNCDIVGHFISVCRKPKNYKVPESTRTYQQSNHNQSSNFLSEESHENVNLAYQSDSHPDFLFRIGNSLKKVDISADGTPISFIIDSGSTINVIDNNTYKIKSRCTPLPVTE